jgi:hypothetical protein
MERKKSERHGNKVGLKLSAADRKLLLEGLTSLPGEYERLIQKTPPSEPLLLTLDQLDDLGGYVAATANHTTDKKTRKKLDAIFEKIHSLLDSHTDENPLKVVKIEDGRRDSLIAQSSAVMGEWATEALSTAKELGIEKKTVDRFPLEEIQRGAVSLLKTLPAPLRQKVLNKKAKFTVAEVASMTRAIAVAMGEGPPMQQFIYLMMGKALIDCLKEQILDSEEASRSKQPKATDRLFQFKITLNDSHPPIWRRIQVNDCTLDKLHEHIQTAMGWTNSHLHHFRVGKHLYGDPELMHENFEEMKYRDSTDSLVSDILPKKAKRFRFEYEYDFGDSWHHEVLFEAEIKPEAGTKYPLCLEGKRACPLEDVGGVWGYQEFVEAMADPGHERHEEFREWIGGKFDAEAFDAKKATKAMRKGLPDWRSARG